MMPPTSIDGTDITGATIDGTDVTEITVDGQTVFEFSAVPFENELHARYDFREYSGTSNFSDLSGNSFDLVNGSITGVGGSINGQQAGQFDGSSNQLHTNTFSKVSEPITISIVLDTETSSFWGRFGRYFAPNNSTAGGLGFDTNDVEWHNFFSGFTFFPGSNDPSSQLITVVIKGSGSFMREDGTQTGSGNLTANGMDIIALGQNYVLDSEFWAGDIGEVLIYPDERTSSEIDDIENYLAGEWGIMI